MDPYKAIITDDHPLMAQATKALIEEMGTIKVVAIANRGRDAIELVSEHRPHMVILDVLLPDMSGAEVAEEIRKQWPDVHVIIFSGVDVHPLIPKFIELQVSGVISKGTGHDTIKSIIRCILDGQVVMPQEYLKQLPLAPTLMDDVELTSDEVAIMTLIVNGNTLDQIAAQVHMSKRSIDNYQRKIYEKLSVKGRAQAIEAFVRTRYYQEQIAGNGAH